MVADVDVDGVVGTAENSGLDVAGVVEVAT